MTATAEPVEVRSLTSELAEDLAWLEQHCRQQTEPSNRMGQLRLAGAIVRNIISPFLGDQPAEPLHLAVVGGAGAGKSTISNMLSGTMVAEANPQAGFTRHPVAYLNSTGQITWSSHVGFLSPLQRLMEPSGSDLDADVYQVRRVSSPPEVFSLLDRFVIWDCPDMTTWAATNYVSRLLEICGLADVIVYVASDERYNDQVPTEYLRLLLKAGKTVVVVLVKMKPENAQGFVQHFQQEVMSGMPAPAVACLTVPQLSPEQLADPISKAASYRIPIVNQVSALASSPAQARKRTVQAAINYLVASEEELLSVAKSDLAALQAWRAIVSSGQVEFDNRYRREFLTSDRMHRFDEALVRLLELLELPGVGKAVSGALWVVRTPYRLLKGLFNKAMQRPESVPMPERPVLEGSFTAWLDMLRKEAARRAEAHPLWAHINRGFNSGLTELAHERFEQGFRSFQASLADEIDRTARAIYEELEKNPVALNTLRGTKFALDVGSMAGALALGGIGLHDLVLVPLAASVSQQLIELLGKQYVDNQREQARTRQQALVAQYLSRPLADYLIQWPSTGGSTYERLHMALRRVPNSIRQLHTEVSAKLQN